ncbi:amidase domain-containing protein [Streptomyces massasporeus]|uniref:amidase domain-containing protein n=1 Tax=Streptomyces massasporeus TaxID=67324 RepID=UPI00365FD3B1
MPLTGAFRHGRRRGVWRWTHTWTVAKKQVLFSLEHSNGKWLGENQSAAKRGDIVFFGWNGKGIYDHAGVITKVKNGKAYVTAHNKNRLDKPLNECLAAPTREPTTRSSASSHTDTEGKMRMKKRVILLCGGLLIVTGIAAAVWWNWLRAPYALADSPKVDVTVRAEKSVYPDVQATAEDVDTLIRIYVQRLKYGDAEGLAELAGPAYEQPGPAAAKYVREYGEAASGQVEVTVLEGSVDYFNPVTVAYEETGQRQNLLLVKDDGHWWIGLGDGDPAAGK